LSVTVCVNVGFKTECVAATVSILYTSDLSTEYLSFDHLLIIFIYSLWYLQRERRNWNLKRTTNNWNKVKSKDHAPCPHAAPLHTKLWWMAQGIYWNFLCHIVVVASLNEINCRENEINEFRQRFLIFMLMNLIALGDKGIGK